MTVIDHTSDHPQTQPLKRCKQCGNEYPATSEYFVTTHGRVMYRCRNCSRRLSLARYHADPLSKEKQREKRNAQPDKIRHYRQTYAQKHPHKEQQRHRNYYLNNGDRVRRQTLRWIAQNPDKANAIVQRRIARKKALPNTFTEQDWRRCLNYWDNCCAVCKRPRGLWHTLAMDHWIPVAKGGGYTPDNIVPLCHSQKDGEGGCNNSKGKRDAHEWLTEKFGKRKTAQILKRIAEYFEWVKEQATLSPDDVETIKQIKEM